jgi:hypothetical protein
MSAALALKADAPPVDTHPYILVKPGPYTKPRYFKTFKQAKAAIVKDITWLKETWSALNIADSVKACMDLLDQADSLGEDGGSIDGICDPYTGMRYKVSLVRRQQV